MKRHITTAVMVAALLVVATGSAAALPAFEKASGDTPFTGVSGAAEAVTGTFSATDHAESYSDGRIGVYAYYQDNESGSVESWANESDSRSLLSTDNDSNRAHLAVKPSELGLGTLDNWRDTGLWSKSYIDAIDVEQTVSLHEPIENLEGEPDGAYKPGVSDTFSSGVDSSGLAWSDDVNTSYLDDARANLEVDEVTENGSGIKVAVIDTGLNTANGSLYGDRVVAAKNTRTNQTGVENVTDGSDSRHGSWVTSAIAANYSNDTHDGVAPDADIIAVKALGDDGSGSTEDIIEGVEYADSQGADVISMSLGSPLYNPTLADEIQEALDNGSTAAFVAAGNTRANHGIGSPSDGDQIWSVAATSNKNASTAKPSYFSQVGPDDGYTDDSQGETRGETPDIAAPGMAISVKLAGPDGAVTGKELSGTSMATPLVSGVAALALEANNSMKNETREFYNRRDEAIQTLPNAGVTEVGSGYPHAELAVNDTSSSEDQESARNDEAEARDAFNRGLGADAGYRDITSVLARDLTVGETVELLGGLR